jgi:hypothetical protein
LVWFIVPPHCEVLLPREHHLAYRLLVAVKSSARKGC